MTRYQLATILLTSTLFLSATPMQPVSSKQTAESRRIIQAMYSPIYSASQSRSGSVDEDYLKDLIPHYQGIVHSSKMLIEASKNQTLITLTQEIVHEHEEELKNLNTILKSGLIHHSISDDEYQRFVSINKKHNEEIMKSVIEFPVTKDFDRDFLEAMIVHQQWIIIASKTILQYTKNQQIQSFAQNIIAKREAGNMQMQDVLNHLNHTDKGEYR
ncbi:hypothetical protein CCZ01_00810 [Helicobacter monodelphidis]|uniref:DUF305 domain-containing protein n=1 Tax=Helicobacter sp. 15-1451 TaxID=2004995 RepID=UPI000DCE5410|nr:DUF305 domain-containing protein [Helicobacter sp. 15-1451]RAX59309.1 hypothetical protein CCZ01_00810 [Helicobacter sp. 15-1451]